MLVFGQFDLRPYTVGEARIPGSDPKSRMSMFKTNEKSISGLDPCFAITNARVSHNH